MLPALLSAPSSVPIYKDTSPSSTCFFAGSEWSGAQCKPIFISGSPPGCLGCLLRYSLRQHRPRCSAGSCGSCNTRSTPATWVDRNGVDTFLRDQCLTNYEARFRQEDLALPNPNAAPRTSTLRDAIHGRMAQPWADGIDDPPLVGEPTRPWVHNQERYHQLSAYARQQPGGGRYPEEGLTHVGTWSVPLYDETSDDDNYHLGLGTLPHRGACHSSPAHPVMARGEMSGCLAAISMKQLQHPCLLSC